MGNRRYRYCRLADDGTRNLDIRQRALERVQRALGGSVKWM